LKFIKKLIVICFCFFNFSFNTYALPASYSSIFFIEYETNFLLGVDGESFSSNFHNALIGAHITPQLIIGQAIYQSTRKNTYESTTYKRGDFSFLEIGPELLYFLNPQKNFYISFNYNPYTKGTRSITGAAEESVDGTSYVFTIGAQYELSSYFYFGISVHYHNISLSKSSISGTESNITNTYSYFYPLFAMSFRL
jgi:hypothetical protein